MTRSDQKISITWLCQNATSLTASAPLSITSLGVSSFWSRNACLVCRGETIHCKVDQPDSIGRSDGHCKYVHLQPVHGSVLIFSETHSKQIHKEFWFRLSANEFRLHGNGCHRPSPGTRFFRCIQTVEFLRSIYSVRCSNTYNCSRWAQVHRKESHDRSSQSKYLDDLDRLW